MAGIVTVAPADLKPLDRVLVNGSWWTMIDVRHTRADGSWRIKLTAGEDILQVVRAGDARLTVDRSGS